MTTSIVAERRSSSGYVGWFVAALLVAHELLKRFLADGGIVAALLSPGGAHSMFTLVLALLLVVVRFVLVVGVPAFVVGKAFELCVVRVVRFRSRDVRGGAALSAVERRRG